MPSSTLWGCDRPGVLHRLGSILRSCFHLGIYVGPLEETVKCTVCNLELLDTGLCVSDTLHKTRTIPAPQPIDPKVTPMEHVSDRFHGGLVLFRGDTVCFKLPAGTLMTGEYKCPDPNMPYYKMLLKLGNDEVMGVFVDWIVGRSEIEKQKPVLRRKDVRDGREPSVVQMISARTRFLEEYRHQLGIHYIQNPSLYRWPYSDVPRVVGRMDKAIFNKTFTKNSPAIKNTCRALKIAHTYKAIQHFVAQETLYTSDPLGVYHTAIPRRD